MDPKLIISILIKGKAKGDLTTVGDAAEARGWSDGRKGCEPRNAIRKGKEMDHPWSLWKE